VRPPSIFCGGTTRKCISVVKPFHNNCTDTVLCLPVSPNIELVWSYFGPEIGMSCVQLFGPNGGGSYNDNHVY
jgi:hypothetical protein